MPGGAAVSLCDARVGRVGTWADDDTILFGAADTTLMRVSAAGGTPAGFGALSQSATTQRWPQVHPGGDRVLFTENSSSSGNWDAANLVVAPLSGLPAEASTKAGGAPKVVVRGAYYGRYVPSGNLIYVQQSRVHFQLRGLPAHDRARDQVTRLVAAD